jgi:cation:H+ antiporter
MIAAVLTLLVSIAVILVGAQLFTNGVEWLGRRLRLGEGAVGSVLAAVGTALPETSIPLVAVLLRQGDTADQIGIGSILGAPFMLSTLAVAATGVAVLVFRGRRASGTRLVINRAVLSRDLGFFLFLYPAALAAGFFPETPWRLLFCGGLLIGYLYYIYLNLRESGDAGRDLDGLSLPSLLQRWAATEWVRRRARLGSGEDPRLRAILLQVVGALAMIVGGAYFFVGGVETIALGAGVSALVLALLIAPVATELPEKANSVIWVRQSKDTLALGNITGAMVFQSSFPTAVGITWTRWDLFAPDPRIRAGLISAGLAIAGALALLAFARRAREPDGQERASLPAWLAVTNAVLFIAFAAYVLIARP